MTSSYDSARLAAGYAFGRPPVHERMLPAARLDGPAGRALDVGCGAGRSTAALAPYARRVVGLEPVPAMLAHCRTVAPHASFVVGSAERLPFASGTFDLVTAAGSLNYTDLPLALAEIARVLTVEGRLLVYDFSGGRRSATSGALADWYVAFDEQFPSNADLQPLRQAARLSSPGWRPLSTHTLPLRAAGLRLLDHVDVEIRLPMSLDAYLRYVLSEVNVDSAIARGDCDAAEAADWCRRTLAPVFADGDVTVVFPGYVGTISRAAR
jgi:SAM-dependent methyltransferase